MVENLKKHWESSWKQTSNKGFVSNFSNSISQRGAESCWRIYADLISRCHIASNPRILELGAGSGNMTYRMLKTFGGSATLVDYSAEAINIAKKNAYFQGLADKISFVQADIFKFNPSEKFDIVHSGGLIEHFSMPLLEAIVRKHIEFAKPNGYVIIMVPSPVWWYRIIKRLLESFHWWPADFETPLNQSALKKIVERNNITVLKSIQHNGLARAAAIIGVHKTSVS